MEPHQNADYFLSSFRDFASYQNPEEVAPTPTTNRWEGMELNENGWDTQPPIPHFIEVPQVPQIPTLYAPPETSSPYPGQQLTGPSFETSTNDPSGSADVAVGALPTAVQDDPARAQRQPSARRRPKDLAKVRELRLKKATQLATLRQTLGVDAGTMELAILNTAIERLEGHTAESTKLAYRELHQLTGGQGKLRHVQCLQAVDDMLNNRRAETVWHYEFCTPDTPLA